MKENEFVLHDFVVQSCLIDPQFNEYGELMPANTPGQLMYDNTVNSFELIQNLAHQSFYEGIAKDIHRCLTTGIAWFENNNASGIYRKENVSVDGRPCPSYMFVDFLIRERWFNKISEQISNYDGTRANALEIAWNAHHAFEYIHPFIDGNGRTGRLLLNYILLMLKQEPVVVWSHDKESYYESIRIFEHKVNDYLTLGSNWSM